MQKYKIFYIVNDILKKVEKKVAVCHLGDAQKEYQIRDRLSFRDILGLASGDKEIKRNTRSKKIGKWQETINRKNSKLFVRVEHVFGFMKECLRGMSSRVVGFVRNAAFNTLTNLVYNLCRYEHVMRFGMK